MGSRIIKRVQICPFEILLPHFLQLLLHTNGVSHNYFRPPPIPPITGGARLTAHGWVGQTTLCTPPTNSFGVVARPRR